jgi:hypothetical protein
MNQTEIELHWGRDGMVVGHAWDRLTDDDLANVGGDRDRMLDTLAHRCDLGREKASRMLDDRFDRLQGEGSYAAARDYRQAPHEFARTQGGRRRDEDA